MHTTALSRSQSIAILRNLGWRIRSSAEYVRVLKDFQRGWNLGSALTVDGVLGPNTSNALRISEARRRAGRGTMSANFSFVEFRCKCGGRFSACKRIWMTRRQVRALEVYRRRTGRPLRPVSGCRCYGHNRAVGGASRSQHLYGNATDLPGQLTLAQAKALRVFTGLGYSSRTGRVLHGDTGPRGRSTSNPVVWRYA